MKQIFNLLLFWLIGVGSLSAQRMVSGSVSDDAGSPLIGANVLTKEVNAIGTITDIDGNFKFQLPAGAATLVVSYAGYETKEVLIGDQSFISITLSEGKILEEVVVVGYGAQAKKDVTGSISTVKGSDIADIVTPSFVQQLAGRSAGVQVQNTSGILGSSPQIRVRGINSINSGTQPLMVVDGVPMQSGNQSAYTPTNALGDINPNDIESFEILKDGAATAIYGSRAANGVVLITTKKGTVGKARFNYDANYGVAKAAKLFDLLGAEDFVTIQNEKYKNVGAAPVAFIQKRADGSTVDTDWQDLVFRNGSQQTHNLSVSGGIDKTRYFFSFGFADLNGISISNELQRYSFRANIDQKVNNWLSVGFSSGITRQVNKGPLTSSNSLSGNIFGTMRMLPNVEALDATNPTGYNIDAINNRSLGRGANLDVISNGIPNQLFVQENDTRQANSWRMLGNGYLEAQIFSGLTFKTQIGLDNITLDETLFNDPRHGDGLGANGRIYQTLRPTTRWNWQNILNYTAKISGAHNLGVTLVQEYQKERGSYFTAAGSNISDVYFNTNIYSGTASIQEVGGGLYENGLASYLGRVNYNYNSKYYLSASMRRDELSALAPGNRIGYFPGASFAYRVSEEDFWGSKDVVSDFRIRGSYAQTGNTNIGDYPYIGSYGSAQYGNQNGISYSNFGNDALKWESQSKLDFGFDAGFYNNKYNLSLAFWQQDNDDIILQAPTAPSLGVPNNYINSNIGRIKGSGVELTFDANWIRKGNFTWGSSLNFSTMKNEVVTLVNGQDIVTAFNILREGESIRSIYGYNYRGVNAANGNPLYETYNRDPETGNITETIIVQADITGQNYRIYNEANPSELGAARALNATRDRVVLGSALPTWFGGLNNSFKYGSFDLNFLLRFSGGNVIMNRTRADLLSQAFNNNSTEILGRWQSVENPGDGQTPRLALNRDNIVNNQDFASTRFVEKGDFLRLQNIGVGYMFPKSTIGDIGISSLRVYVQAQNVLTFTGYSGLDPEVSTNFSTNTGFGEDFNGNPVQKVVSFGVNVGF